MTVQLGLLVVLLLGSGAWSIELSATVGTNVNWSSVRSIDEFDHYWARLPVELQLYRNTLQPRAGQNRIANGLVAVPGQFPYQALLMPQFTLGSGFCAGTILTNSYLLTTAHCVAEAAGIKASGGLAIMGAHDRTIVEPQQQRIRFDASGITLHPEYSFVSVRNDIATVRLNAPLTYTSRVQPVRLPFPGDNSSFAGMSGTVTGFGRASISTTSNSRYLRYAINPVIGNDECLTYWTALYVDDQHMCMSGASGRTPCIGDSGGPLTVASGFGPMQVGVIVFGDGVGCATGYPSVHVRTTHFLPWIRENSDY